ncbi:TPA: potassium transporter TrkA [bacterium]|nr:potassium transporter TrkA [bacterium]
MYVIIIGCGRVGSEVALLLSREGHNVVVIDKNPSSFSKLGTEFNGVSIVGSGYDLEDLKEAGIEKADAVCCVSDKDNVNIISAQVAKKIFGIKKVIARIYDPKREATYDELGLDVIGGTTLIARLIKEKITHPYFVHHLYSKEDIRLIEIVVDDELSKISIEKIEKSKKIKIIAIIDGNGQIMNRWQALSKGQVLLGIAKEEG